jgi:hypothetical protein
VDLLEEIATRLHNQHTAGRAPVAPLLVLGTSERVGSNWLSDTLGTWWQQHNEPLRQQLDPTHPLSSANPDPVTDLDAVELTGLGRHWLVTFVIGKYSPALQVVKETNLFFTTRVLLDLFPDSPVVVASRSPLGVISSFARAGLFTRWQYPARYAQIATVAARTVGNRWAPLLPADDPDEVTALLRLIVANTLLVADAVDGRTMVHVPYEQSVHDRLGALSVVGRLLGEDLTPSAPTTAATDADDTFATTTAKTGLVAHVDANTAERIRAGTALLLEAARTIVAPPVLARATAWLGGDHCYTLAPAPPARVNGRQVVLAGNAVAPRWISHGLLAWRNLLVTNEEYAAFLNALAAAGLENTHHGAHLLTVPMPGGRGGRFAIDGRGRWTVQDGYGDHPAYWATWIGAACFAAHAGARLPTRTECDALTRGLPLEDINAGYRHGDVTPVVEPARREDEVHHPVGNLQVWCADGPDTPRQAAVVRWLHGTAWNTPATAEQVHRPRHRHLLGASRGVGIRLVRDGGQQAAGAIELAELLCAWLTALDRRERSLAELDSALIDALGGLQADVGLGPHVRPGFRKT